MDPLDDFELQLPDSSQPGSLLDSQDMLGGAQPVAIPDPQGLGVEDAELPPMAAAAAGTSASTAAAQAQARLEALNLGGPDAGEWGPLQQLPPAPVDPAVVDIDPLAALELAIEADRPKFKPSPQWQKMLEAVDEETQGQAPSLLSQQAATAEAATAMEDAALGSAVPELRQAPMQHAEPAPVPAAQQAEQAVTEPMEESAWDDGLATQLGSTAGIHSSQEDATTEALPGSSTTSEGEVMSLL